MKSKNLDNKTFTPTSAEKQKLLKSVEKARKVTAPENSLGQWIGYIVDSGTRVILNEIGREIEETKKIKIEICPLSGEGQIKLKNSLGQEKQIDHAIRIDDEYVLIVESKWLKDQRHLNDKGSGVLMMKDILKVNKKIKVIIAFN